MLFFTVLVTSLVASAVAEYKSYEGYKIYQINPSTKNQVRILKALEQNEKLYDFWTPIRALNKTVDVMVEKEAQQAFANTLMKHGINYKTKIYNLGTLVEAERLQQQITPTIPHGNISFDKHHRFETIQAYLVQLSKNYPKIVQLASMGTSYEGRPLYVLKISTGGTGKPIIFVDAGIHAREWIAPSTALYLIQQLVEDPANRFLIEKVDWHIVPLLNPDGYEYSHTNDRYWRKSVKRNKHDCNGVEGTDLNRNFDFHWLNSTNKCNEGYSGPRPFSESETQSLKNYILVNSNTIKLYISLHSDAQCILYPWAYAIDRPDDEQELKNLAKQVRYKMRSYRGTDYELGTPPDLILGQYGGTSLDWVKGIAGINLSYTIELPGVHFHIPPEDIKKVGAETFLGFVAYHDYIFKKFVKRLV